MIEKAPLFYFLFGFISAIATACLALPWLLQRMQKKELLAEQKLLEGQRFLEAIVDSLPVALFCKDYQNDLKFFLWNKEAERIFGLKADQVIGKSDADFFPAEQVEFFRQKDIETMKQGAIIDIAEEKALTAHGERLLHTIKVPVSDLEGNPRFLVGISEDITEAKRTQKLIEEQRLTIIHAEKMTALGEVAGGIAHEINNPLAVIQGKIELLKMYAEEGTITKDQIIKSADVVTNTVTRITKIIRGLKNFARDGDKDKFEKIKLSSLLEDIVDLCQARFHNHRVELILDQLDPAIIIECRSVQISQVLINLMNNAFDAVSGSEKAFVRLTLKDLGEIVQIHVTDSGNGIPEEIASKIMQPFFTTKEVGKGTGLGLSISSGIITSHHGHLFLDRKAATTSFVVELPKIQSAS